METSVAPEPIGMFVLLLVWHYFGHLPFLASIGGRRWLALVTAVAHASAMTFAIAFPQFSEPSHRDFATFYASFIVVGCVFAWQLHRRLDRGGYFWWQFGACAALPLVGPLLCWMSAIAALAFMPVRSSPPDGQNDQMGSV